MILLIIIFISFFNIAFIVFAEDSPHIVLYEGRVLDDQQNPIETELTFRFSFWKSSDFVDTDINPDGSINTDPISSPNYSGWIEKHTLTPNEQGTFSIKLGSVVPLPDLDYNFHKYLQVEIKDSSAPNTSYELLDPSSDEGLDNHDRKEIASSFYSLNANASNEDSFIIDKNNSIENSGLGTIKLQFGDTLAKFLEYDYSNNYFNFNDDVNIMGDLTLTGLVDGYDISGYSGTGILNDGESFSVSHPSRADNLLQITAYKKIQNLALSDTSLDFDLSDEADFQQEDSLNGTDFVSGKINLHNSGGTAFTKNFPFTQATNYTYDSSKIYIDNGIVKLSTVDQVDDDNITGFNNGTHTASQWDAVNNWIELVDPNINNSGNFLSRIMDAGASVDWTNLSWITERPVLKELPNNAQTETAYSTGNIKMCY